MTTFLSQFFRDDALNPYYYVVNDQITYNRNEAILRAGSDPNSIKFYFMDDVWDAVDWSQEPVEDLRELAIRRCSSMREKYDWLCLWLSAGYDSQTVLQYFIDAGVKVDEIATRSKNALFHDPEPQYVFETANQYRIQHNPNVKFTFIDHGLDSSDFYLQHGENWIYQPGAVLRFSKTGLNNVFDREREIQSQLVTKSGRRADITGHDKPRLDLQGDNWYMFMPDQTMSNAVGIKTVDFYLPEDQPEFFVKQVYTAIKFFESISNLTHEMVHQIQSLKINYAGWNLGLGRVPLKCIESSDGRLKTAFDQSPTAGDSVRLIEHLTKTSHPAYDLWSRGIQYLQQQIGPETNLFSINITSKRWKVSEFGRFCNQEVKKAID